MEKNTKLVCPTYFDKFQCIGGECEDSCCIGWDIEIDKKTFKSYYKVKDENMKKMFQKNVHNNLEYTNPDIDYGKIKLKKNNKRCPFLDEENLCVIYKNCGEEYLSNVCTHFPRVLNKIDNVYEISLDVACPEAARIILNEKDKIQFKESDKKLTKYIMSGIFDTKAEEFEDTYIKYFKEIRAFSIEIMQNRKYDLSVRLYILGDFIENLEDETEDNIDGVLEFIKEYDMDEAASYYEKNDLNCVLQVSFMKNIVDSLKILEEIDSEVFREHTKELLKGFNIKNNDDIVENSDKYIKAYNEYTEKFINKYSYMFENHIVNFMYNNLFPFSESDFVFDGYIMLLIRYSLMKFYLVGKYLYNKKDSDDDIVKFIQVFSKAFEHDKNYRSEILDFVKESDFDNMEFAKTLL